MKNSLTLISVTLLILLISCKKEQQKSNTEFLCGKYWKLTALTSDSEIAIEDDQGNIIGHTHDYYSRLPECATDDLFYYNPDSTYNWENNTICNLEEPPADTGTWEFRNNETVIRLRQNYNGLIWEYTDVQLSENQFTCRLEVAVPEHTYQYSATFTRVE